MGETDVLVGHHFAEEQFEPEFVPVERQRLFGVLDDDGNVIECFEHNSLLISKSASSNPPSPSLSPATVERGLTFAAMHAVISSPPLRGRGNPLVPFPCFSLPLRERA